MSYGSIRHITHIDKYGTTHRLEIQKKEHMGQSVVMNAVDMVFDFEHEEFTSEAGAILKLYENPVQFGSLRIYPYIETEADQDLLGDIFESDEDEYRLVWKQGGDVFWTGSLVNDMLRYPELDRPFKAEMVARDFTRLRGMEYKVGPVDAMGLPYQRRTVIATLAGILNQLGYDLPIQTMTTWTEDEINQSQDFLRQIYIDRFALRKYARTANEEDQPISSYEALQAICRNFCLIIKQSGNKWVVHQVSAFDDPENVLVTNYDASGTLVSEATEDIRFTGDFTIKGDTSETRGYPALKQAKATFDHRSKLTNIQFPDFFELDQNNLSRSFSQFFSGDGNQSMRITGRVEAQFPDSIDLNVNMPDAIISIRAGTWYWDVENQEWTESGPVNNRFEMTDTQAPPGENIILFERVLDFNTSNTPIGASPDLEIIFFNAIQSDSPDVPADWTQFFDLDLRIINPASVENNSTAIEYKLIQDGGFSTTYEHRPTWFGDWPTSYAPSAITRDQQGDDLTTQTWGRRGQSEFDRNFYHNLLHEVMDTQRTWIARTEADLYGVMDITELVQYRGGSYAYGGGRFNGIEGDWVISLLRVKVEEDEDEFRIIYLDDPATGTTSTGSSTPVSGDGITEAQANGLYFRQDNNLSEGTASSMRSNLGLGALAIRNTVDTDHIEPDAVTTPKIANGAVTQAKISDNAVSTAKIQNTAVTNAKLADDSVSTGKIQNDAVTLPKAVFADQNVRVADAPTFDQLTLSNPGTAASNAVRADRTLRMLADDDGVVFWNPSTAQNLRGDRTFKPTFLSASPTQRGLMSTGTQAFAGNKTFQGNIGFEGNIQSDSFVEAAGLIAGSRMLQDGDFRTKSIRANELRVKAFVAEVSAALYGEDVLTKSRGVLSRNFDIPGDSFTATIYVEDLEGLPNTAVFENGDWIRLRVINRDAGLVVTDVWGTVSGYQNLSGGEQSWEFFQMQGGADLTVPRGSIAIDYGQSGDGVILRTVLGDNTPKEQIMTWTSDPSDPNNYTLRTQIGRLDGITGASGYGVYVQDRFYAEIGDSDKMTLGRDAGGAGRHGIRIGSNDYWYGDRTASLFGGLLKGDGAQEEAEFARLQVRSNRIYYQSQDPTEVPLANTFSGISASDTDELAEFTRPAFFAGAQSDSIAHTRAAKIRLWPDGRGYFGDDVQIGGDMFNTPRTFLLTASTNYNPAPTVIDTTTDSTNRNLADGSETPYVGGTALEANQIHRYWFKINVATSGISFRPRFRFYLETFQTPPDDFVVVDHDNTAILSYFRLDSGSGSWTPFSIDVQPGYIEFEANASADNQNVTLYAVFYVQPFPGWVATRMRMQSMIADGALTQTLEEARVRRYRRRTSITGGGLFVIDTDIHKRAIDAINGDYPLSLTINDAVL